jgi:hypothetical protein
VVARFVAPAETLGPETWVNWGYPPPRKPGIDVLAVRMGTGKGSFTYYGFDLFGLVPKDINWPRSHVKSVLHNAIPSPTIQLETKTPEIVGYTVFETKNGTMLVHLVSHLPEITKGDAPIISPGSLLLPHGGRAIQAKVVYPLEEQLSVVDDGEFQRILLPDLEIHTIVEITGI